MIKPSFLIISSFVSRASAAKSLPYGAFLSHPTQQLSRHCNTLAKSVHQERLCRSVPLWAAAASQDHQVVADSLTCKLCQRSFSSRNAIFRHLRGDDSDNSDCYVKAAQMGMEGIKSSQTKEISLTAVIRYGYIVKNRNAFKTDDKRDIQYQIGINDIIANTIHDTFVNLTRSVFTEKPNDIEFTTSALSWSTAAKLRQPSLRQDDEVMGATSEVLSFNYRLVMPQTSSKWNDYVKSDQLFEHMQSQLNSKANDVHISLHAIDALLPRSTKFYAERGCSQRGYRFLLPIRWLDFQNNSEESTNHLINWVIGITSTSLSERKHQPRGDGRRAAPECIMKLKKSLKAAESKTVPNRRMRRRATVSEPRNNINVLVGSDDDNTSEFLATDSGPVRLSPGRFGQLWRKERRCWSNFCHPDLRGMAASPSHDATWRSVDKASIVDIVNLTNSSEENCDTNDLDNVYVVLEILGDGFLLGQIPRLISTIVAMTNGWLPTNFFEIATRPDVYIEPPPMAPFTSSLLYFHSPRYHFHELTAKSEDSSIDANWMFDHCISGNTSIENSWEKGLRNKLLSQSSSLKTQAETKWLSTLRDDTAAAIKRNVQEASDNIAGHAIRQTELDNEDISFPKILKKCPEGAYAHTLELLRNIVNKEQWPATSMARSRVIKVPSSKESTELLLTNKKGSVATAFPGNTQSSGSFTVVNMELWKDDIGMPLPTANSRFPDLATSVFDLEKHIIETYTSIPNADGMKRGLDSSLPRPPSTHCAVNRNAQFTPHLDSGRGLGQSVSMIVGLGDYRGGEVMVEGKPYDIKYEPIEFDGWHQLHWTAPYAGERYSLVFFSPDMKRKEQIKDDGNYEATQTSLLAEMHNSKTPFLSPLTYRANSTDALVINEILDLQKGCAYCFESAKIPNMPDGFSLHGHSTVLDVGAHIGVFSRYALSEGVKHVIAYEPEPDNYNLLSKNLEQSNASCSGLAIELHSTAVISSKNEETSTLIRARDENDGKQNTWRHSLSQYSQYIDKSTKLPSESQKATLDRIEVPTIPFFGGALVSNITFVKLDCEGAEIDILLSSNASKKDSWLDVTHLVVEWSFTKERRVDVFHSMISNLKLAGFDVYYEGRGSWWDDTESNNIMWPYPNDIVVFANMM